MIRGENRLALTSVQKDRVNRLVRLELHIGREAGAAHSGDALLLYDFNDLIRCEILQLSGGFHRCVRSVLAVRPDHNRHHARSLVRMGMRLDGSNGSAHTGVNAAADKSILLGNFLSDVYVISDLDNRNRWLSNMHGQGNNYLFRLREFRERNILGNFLAFARMDTSVITGESSLPEIFYIVIDFPVADSGIITELHRLRKEFLQPALCLQSVINSLPCAVLLRVDFALSVFCASALAV